MLNITPFLWFDKEAEEAAKFYVSLFPDSKILATQYYGEAGPGPKGSVMTVAFRLKGYDFVALNGGQVPDIKFTNAISFVVNCEDQAEVDKFWEKLSEGGQKGQCGWLKDKYGVSWQVVPNDLGKYIGGPDKAKSQKAMAAMMKMTKLDLNELKKAYEGK
jgi:predicted 3-demethylubiquinone-9 3-methyltransferase (glyoxalase superfamily)